MGKAVELAGGDARRQTVELAAEHFECPEEAVMLKDGEAIAAGERISYGELIHKHFDMQGGEVVGTAMLTAACAGAGEPGDRHRRGGTVGGSRDGQGSREKICDRRRRRQSAPPAAVRRAGRRVGDDVSGTGSMKPTNFTGADHQFHVSRLQGADVRRCGG